MTALPSSMHYESCVSCKCVNGVHGTCIERGHDDRCHGVHTIYFCDCDCCPCEDTTRVAV